MAANAYGHTRMAFAGQEITQEQAEALLARDVAEMAQGVDRLVRVPLTHAQFTALVCFAFNVGLGAFERSTLLRLLNRGWVDQVPAQLMRWTKAGGKELLGLRRRRAAEAALWRSDAVSVEESA